MEHWNSHHEPQKRPISKPFIRSHIIYAKIQMQCTVLVFLDRIDMYMLVWEPRENGVTLRLHGIVFDIGPPNQKACLLILDMCRSPIVCNCAGSRPQFLLSLPLSAAYFAPININTHITHTHTHIDCVDARGCF